MKIMTKVQAVEDRFWPYIFFGVQYYNDQYGKNRFPTAGSLDMTINVPQGRFYH